VEQKICGLTTVSKKFLSVVYRAILGIHLPSRLDIPTISTPDPTPSLGRENSASLGRFLLAALSHTRTYVLSDPFHDHACMSSPAPASQSISHYTDPAELLSLSLRFLSSAYLASELFLLTYGTLDREPPFTPDQLPRPQRRLAFREPPQLIVGQALDRMAA
jgi:hypothetical protein